jgi:hypothetical protein
MRTPSSALPAWPNGFFEGGGSADFALSFFAAFRAGSFTTFADDRLAAGFLAAGFARDFALALAGLRAFAGFFAFFLAIEPFSFVSRVPGAAQRQTVRCRTGTHFISFSIPDQRRTVSRCAVSGMTLRVTSSSARSAD